MVCNPRGALRVAACGRLVQYLQPHPGAWLPGFVCRPLYDPWDKPVEWSSDILVGPNLQSGLVLRSGLSGSTKAAHRQERKLTTSNESKKFDTAMDTILRADPVKVKAEMEQDKAARAKQRRLGARINKLSREGPVRVSRDAKDNPALQAFNEVNQKAARRKVN